MQTIVKFFVVFLFLTQGASASVFINEIMFNPQGSDTGREWFEFCYSGDGEIDLAQFSFKESEVSRRSSLIQGDGVLSKDECAIVASDSGKFKSEFSNYSGELFDSTLSLKNSGEKIELFFNGELSDSVFYTTDGVPEGKSVSRSGDGFLPSNPTPGNLVADIITVQNDTQSLQDQKGGDKQEASNIAHLPIYKFKLIEVEPPQDIFLRVPDVARSFADSYTGLSVEIFDARGRAIEGASLVIYWGDNSKEESEQKTFFEHLYKSTGVYLAKVFASKNYLSDEKFIKVFVEEPKLELQIQDGTLFLVNKSDRKINLKDWTLHLFEQTKKFNEMHVAGQAKIILSESLNKTLSAQKEIYLKSPSGKYIVKASTVLIENANKDLEANGPEPSRQENKSAYYSSSKSAGVQKVHDKSDSETNSRSAQTKSAKTRLLRASVIGYDIPDIAVSRQSDGKNLEQGMERGAESEKEDTDLSLQTKNNESSEGSAKTFAGKFDFTWVYFGFVLAFFITLVYAAYLFKEDFDDWDFSERN